MASLPKKGVKGANLRKWLIDAIEQLIDYLNSPWLQAGKGINIRRTPAGTIIELQKQSSESPRSSSGGTASAPQDISATVSGGTATLALSGSTATVPVVAGANVNITGGTSGEVIISATGGTSSNNFFPDYGNSPVSVSEGTVYPLDSDMWLIGYAGLYKTSSSGFPSTVTLHIMNYAGTVISRSITLFSDTGIFSSYNNSNSMDIPVCIPIKAGYSVEVVTSGSVEFSLSLFYV